MKRPLLFIFAMKFNHTIDWNGILVMKNKDYSDVEKSKTFVVDEMIEYIPGSVVAKTIIRKFSGNISIMSFDSGEGLTEKISPFETFLQIIDGKAEVIIDGKSHFLACGHGIVIPAHLRSLIKADGRFKMVSMVIKNGYE